MNKILGDGGLSVRKADFVFRVSGLRLRRIVIVVRTYVCARACALLRRRLQAVPLPVGICVLEHSAQEKGWAASEKGETCGPKGGEERCFSIAICYGEQTSGGKGMSRLQGLLYRPMLKRACPGSGFGMMRS